MLTKEAFNALLKTLEEPPEYAYFILATTELHKVPDTIQSRCQRFLFKRVKDDDIVRRLQFIADQEHIKVDREALRAIARHALGSFRDGIALLDQLRSLEKIDLADVTERIGKTSLTFIEDIVEALAAKDLARIAEIVVAIEDAGIPVDLVASDLLALARDKMHEAIVNKEPIAPYTRMTDTLLTAIRSARISPVPALALESALYSLCADSDVTTSAPAARLTIPKTEATSPKVTEAPAKKDDEQPSIKGALVEADELTVQTVLKNWNDLLKAVTPPSVRMSLKNATISKIEKETIFLSFPSAFHCDRVAETQASRTIEDILLSIYKRPVRIRCMVEKDAPSLNAGPSTNLVEAAAEVFGSM